MAPTLSLTQTELFAQKAPAVSVADPNSLISMLRGRDWRTAADLGAVDEKEKRKLRAIARDSAR